jgi:hypothetical protein
MTALNARPLESKHSTQAQDRSRGAKDTPLRPAVLSPYSAAEAITIPEMAIIARRSKRTAREWCARYDLGRRIASGQWMASRVALQMKLDGNEHALELYLRGDRTSEAVRSYYSRLDIPLPRTTIIGGE